MRQPTRLLDAPPGPRCPACWAAFEQGIATKAGFVSVCKRCFVLFVCLAPSRYQRLVPSDLTRLTPAVRAELDMHRASLISDGSSRWRTLPRPPPRQVRVP